MEPSRKRGRSDMWGYFKLIAPDKVRCSVCSAELKYHSNTSSMIRHFTIQHGALVKQVKTNEVDQKPDLDDTLVNMLVEHSQPFPKVATLLLSESTESPRKKGRSDMWEYFKLITPDRVRCSVCSAELKYHSNTSSMIRHFTSQHGALVKQVKTNEVDQKPDLDDTLVNMLVEHSQPFPKVATLLLSESTESPRKKGRSDMWEYFKLITPDRVRCSVCSAELKYHGNTSSMIRHFTSQHGGAANQGKTSQDDRKRVLDEALVNMLVIDSQPFSIVDDCGFKEFVALLDPAYTLPSKSTLKEMVIQRYKDQMAKAQAQVGDSDPDC
ncbi:zinc finger BED domain-containing protein 4-like [Fundulus diaphanus]